MITNPVELYLKDNNLIEPLTRIVRYMHVQQVKVQRGLRKPFGPKEKGRDLFEEAKKKRGYNGASPDLDDLRIFSKTYPDRVSPCVRAGLGLCLTTEHKNKQNKGKKDRKKGKREYDIETKHEYPCTADIREPTFSE